MAEEQDVFISGISGSIQQWGTEATATKMEATLTRIQAQNSAMTQLLTAIKNGESVTQKQTAQAVSATKNTVKATEKASTKETQGTTRTHGLLNNLSQSVKDGWSGSSSGIIDQLRKNQLEATKLERDTQRLIQSGMTRDDAVSTLKQEKRQEEQMGFFKKAALGVIALSAGAEEASMAGFEQRFDLASDIRQSGLMAGIGGLNEGFISIAQTISETGFTFGQAADFTKQFSQAVGVVGVKSTLDFVNTIARAEGGIMDQFSMEFGPVAHIAGEYLDSLRISGQLQGRDQQQLRAGMDSFMSNVQATSNVLKVSMEEAASISKNSLDDESQGMLLTLPKQMRDSIVGGMKMMGGMKNPLAELITARLGAGETNFMQTSQFQEMAGTMAGQKMIGFSQQAATVLETQGDDAFQGFMAQEGTAFIQDLIATMSDPANRSVAIADGTMAMIAQIAEYMQTLPEIGQKISGGATGKDGEDAVMLDNRDQKVQAQVSQESAINTLMPGFIDNVRNLTNNNRAFAEQAERTIKANANIIDGMNNAATGVKQVVVTIGNVGLKLLSAPALIGDFAGSLFGTNVFSNDNKTAADFTSNDDGGIRTQSDKQAKKFQEYTSDMVKQIKNNKEADILEKQAAAQTLKNTLLSMMQGNTAEGSTNVDATQQRILSQLNALLKELRE